MKRFTFAAALFAVTLALFLTVTANASAADIARRPGRGYLPPPHAYHHSHHHGPHHMRPVGPPLHIHHHPHHFRPVGPPPVIRHYRPSFHRPCLHSDIYLMKRPVVEVYF